MERPLFWYQGLSLQPQHFQRQERHFCSLQIPFSKFIQPHFWGIGNIELSEVIQKGTFDKPHKGEFFFEDMTHVIFPGNALMESRAFDESWFEEGRPFTIFIGLKKWNPNEENVTVLSKMDDISKVTTRFVAAAEFTEAPDLHQNGPSAQIKYLHYVLKLFGENEISQLGEYSLIPLAQLEKNGDEISLARNFIPPCLNISGSVSLMNLIKEIRDQITARGYQLESLKRERGIHTAEFGARDMIFLLALRSLNRYIPILYHLTESSQAHPWDVYGVLRQLTGELSSFSDQINVKGETETGDRLLPPYSHNNLWNCFFAAQSLIARLLDDITAGPEYRIELLYDGTYFTAEMSVNMLEGKKRYYLVFCTDTDPQGLLEKIDMAAKVSSREYLPILIARALPGVKLEHLPVPPQEMPRLAHAIYFKLNHHAEQWGEITKGRNIALYWESAPKDLRVELMIIGRT